MMKPPALLNLHHLIGQQIVAIGNLVDNLDIVGQHGMQLLECC